MTDEQQNKLFEAMQGAVDKYKEVGESFKQDNQAEALDKLQAFFNSFQELSSVYEEVREQGSNEEETETEEVEKHDKTSWNDLFSAMDRFN